MPSFDYVVVERRNITSDIPSMDDSRNIFDAILRVSTKRNVHRQNKKIFRVLTPLHYSLLHYSLNSSMVIK